MNRCKLFLCWAILAAAAAVFAQSAPLKIGWARESIDPGKPCVMPGYGNFRVSYGCADPIYATCLVLENGHDAVIFVSLDLISSRGILPAVNEAVKKLAPELPQDRFFISATHTHSSLNMHYTTEGIPKELGLLSREDIYKFVADRIVKAAKKAWQNRRPGKIAWAHGLGVTAFNRRMVYFDDLSKRPKGKYGSSVAYAGNAVIHGRTWDEKFASYESGSDNFIQFLYTFDMQNNLTGAIINTAATSQLSSNPQRKFTSDFWHDVRVAIDKKHPGCYILTQCAGAGDLMPYSGHFLKAEDRKIQIKYGEKFLKDFAASLDWPGLTPKHRKMLAYRKAARMEIAERIAAVFDETLAWGKKVQVSEAVLRFKKVNVDLTPMPVSEETLAAAQARLKKYESMPYKTDGTILERGEFNFLRNNRIAGAKNIIRRAEVHKKGGKFETDIALVRVGDAAFASNCFELFMDYMHRIQGRSPFIQTFVAELAGHNGKEQYGGYLPTERAMRNRGYSATVQQCPVSPQGGQELVEATVKGLKELYK